MLINAQLIGFNRFNKNLWLSNNYCDFYIALHCLVYLPCCCIFFTQVNLKVCGVGLARKKMFACFAKASRSARDLLIVVFDHRSK